MSYWPARCTDKLGWEIKKDVEGRMPKELSGMFTEEKLAIKAIDAFKANVEAKRLRSMPAAQRKKVLEAQAKEA